MHARKTFLTLLSFFLYLLFFTVLGILTPILASTPLENGGYKTISSKNDFYQMVDNYYDPEEFSDFRHNSQNVNMLASFYNKLNSNENFDIISSFNQAIDVTEFKGDNRFYYNSEEFIKEHPNLPIRIKALQLNHKAYDFYKIKIDTGKELPWDNVSYKDTYIPILLGAEYKEYYSQGDIIKGNYYSKNVAFKVIGFLESECNIKYQNISDINLDTYMLIPYPSTLWKVNSDFQFESILYFAMINCNIRPHVSEAQIIKEIKEIANQTGFSNFSLVGIDNFQIHNIELIEFFQKHQKLCIFFLVTAFIILNIISVKKIHASYCIYISSVSAKENYYNYNKIYISHIVIPYAIALFLGIFLSTLYLKKILTISILFNVSALLLSYVIIYACTHVMNNK